MSSLRKSLFSLSSAAALMLLALGAQAKTYYVSNDGNDNNDGLTAETPFQHIQKGKADVFHQQIYVPSCQYHHSV